MQHNSLIISALENIVVKNPQFDSAVLSNVFMHAWLMCRHPSGGRPFLPGS